MTHLVWRPFFRLALAGLLTGTTASSQLTRTWNQITTTGITNLDEPALARTKDGTLHVVWRQKSQSTTFDLRHRATDSEGRLKGESQVAVGGWNGFSIPALLVVPDGSLELLFGGVLGSPDRSSPFNKGALYKATAPAEGTPWQLHRDQQSQDQYAYVGTIGAAIDKTGERWSCWAASSKFLVQKGLGLMAGQQLHDFGCCPYLGQVAVDAGSGAVVAGWYSNANQKHGILLRPVSPSLGEVAVAPGSASESGGRQQSRSPEQQLALVSRIGAPGVYLAYCAGYPTCTSVQLWAHGAPQAFEVAKVQGGRTVNLTPAPEGRLWVMWSARGEAAAVRTNKAATRFGPPTRFSSASATTIFKLRGEGSAGPLDAFVNTGSGLLHTHVLPPLQVSVAPGAIPTDKGGTVTFTVSDVGDPVAGATIVVAGQKLMSDAAGKASYSVPKGASPGAVAAEVTMSGYENASVKFQVQPPPPPKK